MAVQAARASWRWWTKAATAITTSYFGWAQGTGQLRSDVDIQLMSHTLYCIANSAGERLIFAEANFAALQQVLAQQCSQVVTPYLNEAA